MVYASHMEGKIKFSLQLKQALRNDHKSAQLRKLKKQKENIKNQRETVIRRTVKVNLEQEETDGHGKPT